MSLSPSHDAAKTARRHRAADVLAALGQTKVALMLALGFSSGLPFMLIGNTLTFWLAEAHIRLAAIGFASWIGLTYAWKFLWGAMVDHLPPPLLASLGRRRGWMIVSQLGVGAGLIGMSLVDPLTHLPWLLGFGLLTSLSAATQDTVIDAWRIESAASPDELGLLTSAYQIGFRVALVATESVILVVAAGLGWPLAYRIYGALIGVGLIASLLIGEPQRADAVMAVHADQARRHPLAGLYDAVIGPLLDFFRTHGAGLALLMLAAITSYHLCDYLRGPMVNPYYAALGISKVRVALVRASIGLVTPLIGIALGGVSCLRLGVAPTLIVGAFLQPLAVAAFATLGFHGGDYPLLNLGPLHLSGFEVVMGFDGLAMSYAGVALVSYMSTLTSLGYTATQYALLTSALALAGKILKGFSGTIVEALEPGHSLLQAYGLFYLMSAAIGLPAIALTALLATRSLRRRDREAPVSPASSPRR